MSSGKGTRMYLWGYMPGSSLADLPRALRPALAKSNNKNSSILYDGRSSEGAVLGSHTCAHCAGIATHGLLQRWLEIRPICKTRKCDFYSQLQLDCTSDGLLGY